MTLSLKSLARALGGEVSNGQVLAPGPGHSPKDRSLSVKLDANAPDGFLTHSFAGDDPIVCRDHVRSKAGLEPFKPNGGDRDDATITAALMAAVQQQARNGGKPRGRLVATYDYTDENAKLLYQVLKYDPKTFRQRQPDGNDGWVWSLSDVRRVPYRLPELLKFPDATVFVCEGEKDADRVAALGHCATTVASGKWTDDCIKALAGRDCIILQDMDAKRGGEPGRTKALTAARALHGVAKSIRIVLLPELSIDVNDVSDWLDIDPRRAEKLIDVCFSAPEWESTPDTNSIADNDSESDTAAKKETKSLLFINIAAWHSVPVPERQWVVRDRVPLLAVTLLSGDGGVGKTILALHLAAATALARDWLKALPEPGPVLVVCCEDDSSELHRRLDRIVQHCGGSFEELAKGMNLISLAGEDAVMAAPNKKGLIMPTDRFKQVYKTACDIQPKLIVLDNSADIFAGNENDRAQVRQFITLLRGMAIRANAGVLLTSHPSLTGINTGTGLSGSTAWNASVRSRMYFKRATTEKDEEPDPDLRVLEVMKANYGPVGETIEVRWKDGLFLPVGSFSNLQKLAAEQKADQTFLTLLDRFNGQGRNTCEKSSAHNYAPTLFAKEDEAKQLSIKRADFEAAMRRLFAANKIHLKPYGPPSKGTSRLAPT